MRMPSWPKNRRVATAARQVLVLFLDDHSPAKSHSGRLVRLCPSAAVGILSEALDLAFVHFPDMEERRSALPAGLALASLVPPDRVCARPLGDVILFGE